MEFNEIEKKIFDEKKICAMKDKYGKIKVADGTIIVNNLTIRNVYEVYAIENTLCINENTINLDDVKDFLVLGI